MTMIPAPHISGAQTRLASYYLSKLRAAAAAIRRGEAAPIKGLNLIDQEWGQIEFWQSFAAERGESDHAWARLCLDFALAAQPAIVIRHNLAMQRRWFEAGLWAARQLGDMRAELELLYALSNVMHALGALDQAEAYAERLLAHGTNLPDRLARARGFYCLGAVAEERGLFHEALEHDRRALAIFAAMGARLDEARTLSSLGAVMLYQGDFEQAYEYFTRDLQLMEAAHNMSEVCRGLLAAGQACLMLEDYGQAESFIRRAIRLSRSLGFEKLLGAGLIMLAQWYGEQGALELELKYYAEGVAVARAVGAQRDVIHGLSNAGLSRMLAGDPQRALVDLQEGLALARRAGIPRFICNLQRNIADAYIVLGDPEAARPALLEALALAHEMNSRPALAKALTAALAYAQLRGWNAKAARWAGGLAGQAGLDGNFFQPACARLESALGGPAYRRHFAAGQALSLEEVLAQALVALDQETAGS